MSKMTLKEMQDAVDNAPKMTGAGVFYIPGANVYCKHASPGAFSIAYLANAIAEAKANAVEWKNGDEVCHPSLAKDQKARWVGYGAKKELSIIECLEGCIWKLDRVWTSELTKPESQEDKEKRKKREEGIHKISMDIMNNVEATDGPISDYRHDIAVYLYDAGYEVVKGKEGKRNEESN